MNELTPGAADSLSNTKHEDNKQIAIILNMILITIT